MQRNLAEIQMPMPATPTHYHKFRQVLFEHSLLMMEAVIGRKGRVIDLGAGHCQFALIAHEMGWEATALDVRPDRKPDLPDEVHYISADLNSDAWSAEDYDVISCLGVYYHLNQTMQHRLLDRCSGKPLILDTHFAKPPGVAHRFGAGLSETYEKNGEIGADYIEAPGLADDQRKRHSLLASHDNPTSWWQTKGDLTRTLHQRGWPHTWVMDYFDMNVSQRTFWLCLSLDNERNRKTGIRI